MNNALVRLESVLVNNMKNNVVSWEDAERLVRENKLMNLTTWARSTEKTLVVVRTKSKVMVATKEKAQALKEAREKAEQKRALKKELKELEKKLAQL